MNKDTCRIQLLETSVLLNVYFAHRFEHSTKVTRIKISGHLSLFMLENLFTEVV